MTEGTPYGQAADIVGDPDTHQPTPMPDPAGMGTVVNELADVLWRHYGGHGVSAEDIDRLARTTYDAAGIVQEGDNPRLNQLQARTETEAAYAITAALSAYPNLRADALAHAGVVKLDNERAIRALTLLEDMDRCEHGRHSTDACLACPGGHSTGNLLCPPCTRIGHSLYGPIVVPEPADLRWPSAWQQQS